MAALRRRFASGRGRWWSPSVLYLLALLTVYLAGVVVGTVASGEPTIASIAYEPLLFPVLFMYTPPAIAVVVAFRGYAPISSVTLGLSAGLGFAILGVLAAILGTSGNGDSSLWALSLTFAGIGLATAVAGHAIGLLGRFALDRLG